MAIARGVRGFLGRTQAPERPNPTAPALPQSQWDNVGLAVDRALDVFVDAVAEVSGVHRIEAKSSGPTVHFLVFADRPREHIVEAIEERLFPIAQSGALPTLDYHVRELDGISESPLGYVTVFSS